MALSEGGYSHSELEMPFVKYFNRCKEIGMTKLQIQKNFKYLGKYYSEMVIDVLMVEVIFKNDPSLDKLFNNWCNSNKMN